MSRRDSLGTRAPKTKLTAETTASPLKGSVFAPTNFSAASSSALKLPSHQLHLDWIYGYRGWDGKSNVKILNSNTIVYNAAAQVILQTLEPRAQSTFGAHDNDVMCFAIHPTKQFVASGQECTVRGSKKPKICIWRVGGDGAPSHSDYLEIEDHQRSVNFLEFDPSGRFLCSIGGDDDNTMNIYDFSGGEMLRRKPSLLASAGASKAKVVQARWNPKATQIVTCGVKHIKFWTLESGLGQQKKLKSQTGVFAANSTQTVLGIEWSQQSDLLYAAGYSGDILIFEKNTQIRSIKAHDGPVFAVLMTPTGLISSGKDGKILKWQEDVASKTLIGPTLLADLPRSQLPTSAIWLPTEYPRALDFHEAANELFIGTSAGRIWSISLAEPNTIKYINGAHCSELWGLAAHPLEECFATVSADGLVSIWNSTSHLPIRQKLITAAANESGNETDAIPKNVLEGDPSFCISFSCDGSLLAIGLANGATNVYFTNNLELKASLKRPMAKSPSEPQLASPLERTAQVRSPLERTSQSRSTAASKQPNAATVSSSLRVGDVKFAPKGQRLAVGISDGVIYMYDLSQESAYIGACKGHSGGISHIDWSQDSQFLQSCSTANELLFWDANSLQQIAKSSDLRDTVWASQTCILGWSVKGIWPPGVDGTHVNAVAKSKSSEILASGDDDCLVKLFRYPAFDPKAEYRAYGGHASHVTNVAFNNTDALLFSTGGQDCSVCQWRVENSATASQPLSSSGSIPRAPIDAEANVALSDWRLCLTRLRETASISDEVANTVESILEKPSLKELLLEALKKLETNDDRSAVASMIQSLLAKTE